MVRSDRRSQYGTSFVAVRRFGGKESEERDELGSGGMGRYSAQDCAFDSVDEESDTDSNALESGSLNP